VDAVAATVGYESAGRVAAVSLAPQFEWQRPSVYALAGVNLALFERAVWMAQTWGDAAYLSRPLGLRNRLRLEGSAALGASVHADNYRTTTTRGEFRAHFSTPDAGGWAGLQAATGWTSEAARATGGIGPTFGAWGHWRSWNGTAAWTPLRIRDGWVSELNVRAFASLGRVDVIGSGGWRAASSEGGASLWGGASVTYWLGQRTALVLAGGNYPSDLLQDLPRGQYVSLAVRLTSRRPPFWTAAGTSRAIYAVEPGAHELRFRITVPASRVDLVGDWTAWKPVPLSRRADGRWGIRVTLAAGVYRFNLVLDGKQWIVPEGVAVVDDGFGGKTAVLVVP
jgi:hypothetical protein